MQAILSFAEKDTIAANRYIEKYISIKKGWGLYKQGKIHLALEILQKIWDETPFKLYSIRSHLEEVKKAAAGQN